MKDTVINVRLRPGKARNTKAFVVSVCGVMKTDERVSGGYV